MSISAFPLWEVAGAAAPGELDIPQQL